MAPSPQYDAVVVGAGPNGLAAGIELARSGRSVLIREARDGPGGGVRSAALTLPGFVHDPFSAVHPLAVASPFFRTLDLESHGLEWVHPDALLAHPFDDGSAALLERSTEATAAGLGVDGDAYERLVGPFVREWERLAPDILGPLSLPRHPLLLARFGLRALRSAQGLTSSAFESDAARALFCGMAAHSALPLDSLATAAYGLVLAAAGNTAGWPIPRGGADSLSAALTSVFRHHGGVLEVNAPVASLDELPTSGAVLLDLTPRQILRVAGERLPGGYSRALERFRYGPGVFKMDWALSGPLPWRAPGCERAATVHLVGSMAELTASERLPWRGEIPEQPFVLLVQPSRFDGTRAPAGCHTAWAYCHVPNGCTVDMTSRIEAQVERFAPGFRDLILARSVLSPADLERRDANLVGGDINGGAGVLGQLFFRPVARPKPCRTPVRGLYICSASTPPGGGVHGMCGFHAARTALADGF